MSFLKQIDDKGAVLEWSPIAGQPNLVALGTKVNELKYSGFEEVRNFIFLNTVSL